MNDSKAFWKELIQSGITDSEYSEIDEKAPWFIIFMQGFAGWVAGLFLLGFFGSVFSQLFFSKNILLLIFFGSACCVLAYLSLKKSKIAFVTQLALPIHLCGQLLIAAALMEMFNKSFSAEFFILLGSIQLFLGMVMNDFSHRFISFLFGLISLIIGFEYLGLFGIPTIIFALVFALLVCNDLSLIKYRKYLEPMALASAIAMIVSLGFLLSEHKLFFYWSDSKTNWWYPHAPMIASAVVALVLVFVLMKIAIERKFVDTKKTKLVLGFTALFLITFNYFITGLSAGLLLLTIGFYKKRRFYLILGVLATILFFSWYYYFLDITLLNKSLALMTVGGLSCLAWWGLCYKYNAQPNDNNFLQPSINKVKLVSVLVALVSLVLINLNIYQKEDVLANGETVILKLAPLDPRSIMQGDYMRLRFDVQNKTRSYLQTQDQNSTYKQKRQRSLNGFIKLKKDKQGVAHFDGLIESDEPSNQLLKIPFRVRGYRVLLSTDAFYFEEGKAKHFEQAEFGEFKLSQNGEMILANLLDKSLKQL